MTTLTSLLNSWFHLVSAVLHFNRTEWETKWIFAERKCNVTIPWYRYRIYSICMSAVSLASAAILSACSSMLFYWHWGFPFGLVCQGPIAPLSSETMNTKYCLSNRLTKTEKKEEITCMSIQTYKKRGLTEYPRAMFYNFNNLNDCLKIITPFPFSIQTIIDISPHAMWNNQWGSCLFLKQTQTKTLERFLWWRKGIKFLASWKKFPQSSVLTLCSRKAACVISFHDKAETLW